MSFAEMLARGSNTTAAVPVLARTRRKFLPLLHFASTKQIRGLPASCETRRAHDLRTAWRRCRHTLPTDGKTTAEADWSCRLPQGPIVSAGLWPQYRTSELSSIAQRRIRPALSSAHGHGCHRATGSILLGRGSNSGAFRASTGPRTGPGPDRRRPSLLRPAGKHARHRTVGKPTPAKRVETRRDCRCRQARRHRCVEDCPTYPGWAPAASQTAITRRRPACSGIRLLELHRARRGTVMVRRAGLDVRIGAMYDMYEHKRESIGLSVETGCRDGAPSRGRYAVCAEHLSGHGRGGATPAAAASGATSLWTRASNARSARRAPRGRT